MWSTGERILEQLMPLIGKKLSIARYSGLRAFHFGPIRATSRGTVGDYALHINCPWRIEGPDGIVTGSGDFWEPADPTIEIDLDTWEPWDNENSQDRLIRSLLEGYDPQTRSFVNETELLVVEELEADEYGGASLTLSGGYQLALFPDGTRSEDWRLFRPDTDGPHFVVAGGKAELVE